MIVFAFNILPFSICCPAFAVSADNLCSRGESYWCSEIRVAKQCGAIQHCKDTVWKNTVAAKVGKLLNNQLVCNCKYIYLNA